MGSSTCVFRCGIEAKDLEVDSHPLLEKFHFHGISIQRLGIFVLVTMRITGHHKAASCDRRKNPLEMYKKCICWTDLLQSNDLVLSPRSYCTAELLHSPGKLDSLHTAGGVASRPERDVAGHRVGRP
jgi:hypothetical protein